MCDFKRNIPISQLLAGSPKYVLINVAGDKGQDRGKHAWAPVAWTWTHPTVTSAVVSLPKQVTSLAQTQGGWAGTEFTS